jgi:hypothetical protein
MSRIIIEYNPVLSKESEKLIRDNVTPSMISNDESSCQYEISIVAELLSDYGETDDADYINGLINDDVSFIEF